MKGHMNTDKGQISIETNVLAKYAGICALECFGIVGMASVNMKEGIADLLTREHVKKGVRAVIKDNKITIDFHIIVAYGVSIAVVAENLIDTVTYKIEQFTGLDVEKINIYVEGVRTLD
ncbi:MAG: Asp23/Gls24 family envelope stress response protein [Anaerostipes sp.]|uniref:Asp23/Gls24 family envelope stress response protein n=1 Tax=Anaerostipes sp. 992a TaxID=1261637 RepID=UPI000950B917|nr:Asp23/Gls24 family envelope stress response protein [Anaerostipes sp. 992a]MCI5951728.1 Asp23/Gls24 family envelope stress response protein [Anaerostipes sp.]MDD5969083.1 Asp23/Gls24 family envelope stress response protein [Anaerostipes sp.]OLR62291.1 alkaline-shock protein [Anaerostipes sp. 992a]